MSVCSRCVHVCGGYRLGIRNIIQTSLFGSRYSRTNRWEHALCLLRALTRPSAFQYKTTISALGAAHRWAVAVALLTEADSKTPSEFAAARTAVIHACGRGSKWELAVLLSMGGDPEGHNLAHLPNILSCGAALAACMQGAAWMQALSLLMKMSCARVIPNSLCYSAVLGACGRAHEWSCAMRLFRLFDSRHYTACPKTYAYKAGWSACIRAALQACKVAYQWEQALAFISPISHHSSRTLVAVIGACNKSSSWDVALALFESFRAQHTVCMKLHVAALEACARAVQWTTALSIMQSIKQDLLEWNKQTVAQRGAAIATVANASERARMWQITLEIFSDMRQMRFVPGNISALRSVVKSLGHARNWVAVMSLLDEMRTLRVADDPWAISAFAWSCDLAGQRKVFTSWSSSFFRVPPEEGLSAGISKELQLLEFVRCHAQHGSCSSVLDTIEMFALQHRWLKISGGRKAELLESSVCPGDHIVELGTYVGYSALLLARKLCSMEMGAAKDSRQIQSPLQSPIHRVISIEAHPLIANIARAVINIAGFTHRIDVRVGRAADWFELPVGVGPIDLLVLDHRGAKYHEDLSAAEPFFRQGSRVVADNVLHPGAPLFLDCVRGRYRVQLHTVVEFGIADLEDWVALCEPQTVPLRPCRSACSDPELRQWAAHIDTLCHQSVFQKVDWYAFQSRLKPVLLRKFGHAAAFSFW